MTSSPSNPSEQQLQAARAALVASLRARRELDDERTLAAIAAVPRHLFVPEALRHRAYDDVALAIGHGQTISQPHMVALMTRALELKPTDHVLEVGTGSGYQAAVLAQLCRYVTTVEVREELGVRAARTLRSAGVRGVRAVLGDASGGYAPDAPYDAILVTAGADDVAPGLWEQLVPGGRLVAPVGPEDMQVLVRWRKVTDGEPERQELTACRFVPLVGEHGRGG
ncbi:MAG: protein-L-isoaspartate(D-aspartate) O-methyltransferase [Myxococcota bacterium]